MPALGYFQGSVSGLAPGSPVTFQGLRIGQVTDVNLEYDPKTDAIRAPVRFEVEPERIADMKLAEARGPVDNARMLVRRGLRAQLQSSNLLTGQQQVALIMVPDAKPAEIELDGDIIIMPTVPGQFAGITDSVNQLLTKVNQMPFEQIGANLNETLHGFNDLANSRELKEALASLQGMLVDAQNLLKRLDADLAPALRQLP